MPAAAAAAANSRKGMPSAKSIHDEELAGVPAALLHVCCVCKHNMMLDSLVGLGSCPHLMNMKVVCVTSTQW